MNWGYKIFIFYMVFVLGIVYLIYRSSQINTDLVTPDYYKKELAFQGMIEKQKHYAELKDKIQATVDSSKINISLPAPFQHQKVEADITLYCPSNQKYDRSFHVSSQDGKFQIPKSHLSLGYYVLQADWTSSGIAYYAELNLYLQ